MFFRFLLRRKLIVGLFITFIFIFGFFGLMKLDKELFPPITFDQAMVFVATEDMPAADVEQFVTKPIETSLDGITGVENYESSSTIGNSAFFIKLEKGNGDNITKDIEATVNGLHDQLLGVEDILVQQMATDQPFTFYMDVTGDNLEEMSQFANEVIKPRLEALPEVREVDLTGLEEKEVIIELKSEELEKLGLQQEEVMQAIQQTNKNEHIGELSSEQNQPSLRWDTTFTNIDDIKTLPIPTESGIKELSDIASIKEKVSEQTQMAWKNGNPDFVLMQIGRTTNSTQVDMAAAVRAEIDKIKNEGIPENVHVGEIVAQADYVNNAIDGLTANIIIGGIIAIVVLLLFLRNARATFIVGLSIPASILLTILAMSLFGFSFNLASLIGLGLGIGMMVDASIVVLESIYKKKELGLKNSEAVIEGTKEVTTAVLASMLTTIVVFLPIGILDNDIGKVVFVLAIVVTLTLVSSVLVSFTWIPTLAASFLKVKKPKKRGKIGIIDRYGRMIAWLTRKKRRRFGVMGLFLVLFMSSFLLLPKVPMTIMPDIFDRYTEVLIELEPGVTPTEREKIAKEMDKQLGTITDVENNLVIDNVSILIGIINMTPEEVETMTQSEVTEQIAGKLRKLEDDYPIVSISTATDGVSQFPVQLRVSGDDYNKLTEIGDTLAGKLKAIDGISFVNSGANQSNDEVGIILKDDKIKQDGITTSSVYQQIQALFSHVPVGEFIQDGEAQAIYMKGDISIDEEKELLKQEIITPTGEEKLSKYISLQTAIAPTQIDRKDGERFIEVRADIEGRDLGAVNRDVQKLIQNFDTEEGYTVSVSGDLDEQQQVATDLIMIFAVSLFLVFVVMAIQFNSLKHPLIILSIIPLTITGVIIGLFLTQKELNVMSGIGIIMLVGIVLNNGILLIDRVKQLRNKGMSVNESIVSAGKERIRPIFMTTLTTVGGMIPLAFATDASSGYQSPLAVVIISGLLFATLITLILIPSLYLIFEDIGNGLKRIFKKKKKKPSTEDDIEVRISN